MRKTLAFSTLLLAIFFPVPRAKGQPPGLPEGAESMKIVVESISGKAQFGRNGRFQRLLKDSSLQHGDEVIVELGAVCKLEFQHPDSGAVLSAAILRGYTDLTVAEAYIQGEQSRTQLDLNQGVLRAGVVRTAVPPSYRVRTPRTVLAVRGTEIAELEATEWGDRILMGRVGVAMVHDSIPWFRSVRAGQGTEKLVEEEWRNGRLLRAIENALLESRVILAGPHRRAGEVQFDRQSYDLFEFPGDNMSGANPSWDRTVNGGEIGKPCRQCGGTLPNGSRGGWKGK